MTCVRGLEPARKPNDAFVQIKEGILLYISHHLKGNCHITQTASEDCDRHGTTMVCSVEFAQVSSLIFEQEYRVGRRDRKTWNIKRAVVFVSQLALTPQSCLSYLSPTLLSLTCVGSWKSVMFGWSIYIIGGSNQDFILPESWLLNIGEGTTGQDHMEGYEGCG